MAAAAAFGNAGAGAGGMAGGPRKAKKAMTLPINQIFRMLQNRVRVQIWLYENTSLRLEGVIVGFDEYMNLVLDQAEEIDRRHKDRKKLGMIMLKGENITLMHEVAPSKVA